MKDKYKWVKESYIEEIERESSKRIKEIHLLRNEIKELNKKLYPFSIHKDPQIMNMNMERVILEIALSIGEYRDLMGNHIVIKDFTDKKQEYKYFIDTQSFRSREYVKEIIEMFFTDLIIKYEGIE